MAETAQRSVALECAHAPEAASVSRIRTCSRRVCALSQSRKGFCKHALRAGADLLPVYIFGQTQLFYTLGAACPALASRSRPIATSTHARSALSHLS
eukprot:6152631-Pleurochrysis_carterae.AAC.4